ncbi:MAG: ATP-binding protein [Desulfobacteraceae bacterium]|nr:ATP-binding protein [Desulfobacteraceae bacterium]
MDRTLENHLKLLATKFPVITLTGPRQSGKSTLVRHAFPEKQYVSCEDPDARLFAVQDPRSFLDTYSSAIIDEAQKVPEIFSYIQTKVDFTDQPGQYILTGSHDFLLLEQISQSLAGRTAVLKLLPFSLTEIYPVSSVKTCEAYLYKGFYPRLYKMNIAPEHFYSSYVQTYIERDVRLIKNISDIGRFQLLLRMCAGRVGQLLNLSSLANECGISHTTVKSWIAILEASYIIFLLRPHHINFNKRLVKMPKLYFYDTGLAAYLLGIQSVEQLQTHYCKGGLFESFIISEIIKKTFNAGRESKCYFWRDKNGNEIDCLIEKADKMIPIEIKSGKTVTKEYFKGVDYYRKLAGERAPHPYIVYGGDKEQARKNCHVIPWHHLDKINL